MNYSVPTGQPFNSDISEPLEILDEIPYEFNLDLLEPSLLISMLSRKDGCVISVLVLCIAGMIHTSCCAVASRAAQ